MNEYWLIFLGFLGGIGIAVLHFGGLWLTAKQISRQKRYITLLTGSFFIRLALAALGLYLILTLTGAFGLLAATAGFILTQLVFVRLFRRKD
jgi:F1F0 ATPase subunit 2